MRTLAAVLLGGVLLTGCGGSSGVKPPSEAQVQNALTKDSRFAAISSAQRKCVADVLIRYEPAADLQQLVAGTKTTSQLPDPAKEDAAAAGTELDQCVTSG